MIDLSPQLRRRLRVRAGKGALGLLAAALTLLAGCAATPPAANVADRAGPCAPGQELVVCTTEGAVRAVVDQGTSAFKGIPCARPPVGPLRWQPTQPVPPWSGVGVATAFSAVCPQLSRNEVFGSEDCLTLNVWKPSAVASGPLPRGACLIAPRPQPRPCSPRLHSLPSTPGETMDMVIETYVQQIGLIRPTEPHQLAGQVVRSLGGHARRNGELRWTVQLGAGPLDRAEVEVQTFGTTQTIRITFATGEPSPSLHQVSHKPGAWSVQAAIPDSGRTPLVRRWSGLPSGLTVSCSTVADHAGGDLVDVRVREIVCLVDQD